MKSIIRNIIIGIVVIGLGFLGYKLFLSKKTAAPAGSLQTTSGIGTGVAPDPTGAQTAGPGGVGGDMLALLINVKSINLDDSLFTKKSFDLLQDFNRPIPPDTNPGRQNPFAPLGTDGGPVTAQVLTSNPSSITPSTSTLNGTLAVSDAALTRWFEYGTSPALGTKTPTKSQTNPGVFAETITGLTPNVTYYVKAVAVIGGVTVNGNVVTWKTAQGGTQPTAKKSAQ